jgi:hypothetical protein
MATVMSPIVALIVASQIARRSSWRSRAEGARIETPSGLVLQGKTAEVLKIVVNRDDGKTDWKATAQAREIAAARIMGR